MLRDEVNITGEKRLYKRLLVYCILQSDGSSKSYIPLFFGRIATLNVYVFYKPRQFNITDTQAGKLCYWCCGHQVSLWNTNGPKKQLL